MSLLPSVGGRKTRASAAAPGSNVPADQAAIIASFWRMRPLL
jgi:hypothetical protein